MKIRTLAALLAIILSCITNYSHAQKILDKIDKATNNVDRTSDQADKVSKTASKVGRFFGIGKKKTKEEAEKCDEIKIIIANGNLAYVKKLNTLIQTISGVSESKMKFNKTESSITATFNGSAENLLAKIQAKSDSGIKDEDIMGIEDGQINIKAK
jgi:hypothetical protein